MQKIPVPGTVYCSTGYNFVFVGFDTGELSTYILRAYRSDNTFSSLLDTVLITDTLVEMTTNGPEYVLLPLFGNEQDSLLNGSLAMTTYRGANVDTDFVPYDWEIYIPKDNRTFRVTNIKVTGSEQQTVETCDPKGNVIGGFCYLQFGSYMVDGRTYSGAGFDQHYSLNFIFLKK